MTSLQIITRAALVALVSCGGGAAERGGGAPPEREDIRRGEALYDRYCALCHAPGGAGYAADNARQLSNPSFLRTATDEFLRIAIDRGRPGTPMSAFGASHGGPLGPGEVDRIIAYLRSLDRGAPLDVHGARVKGDAGRGAELYQQRCAGCHGERGEGDIALSLNNPTFLASASDGFIRHAIEHGRPGTEMPAFGRVLAPQDLDDLTRAIRRWSREVDAAAPALQALPGLDQLVTNPGGPPPSFELREDRYLPVDQVAAALRAGARMVLLDARPVSDWHKGRIPGAFPMPFYDQVDAIAEALPRDGTWIIAYCACPHAASGKVVDALRARGFTTTAILDEGIHVWAQRGHPTTVTAAAPADR
jgi:cytochrome c oxidase cbb3-type subunit III